MQRELRIELGRVWMTARQVGRLRVGSRIELEPSASDEAAAWVAGRRIASGEVVVMDGNLCLRVQAPAGAAAGRE